MMKRIWNYFFYCTYRLIGALGDYLIVRPLVYMAGFVPLFLKNWEKGKKTYQHYMQYRNILTAFEFMLFTTTIAYATICWWVLHYFDIIVGDKGLYYFIGVCILTYATNYILLWRADIYKTYFRRFDKSNRKRVNYLHAILFHLVGWSGFIIYLIEIGFDF